MATPPNALPSSRTRLLVALAAAIAVLAAFSPRDLWSPDEPRYGRIAYEMERGGSWLVSHFNGDFDAEKPPLGYWLMAAGGRVAGGVEPIPARVPCALLAALAVVATAGLATRWFRDASLGATAALLFATGALVLWNSSRAGLDLPMTAFSLLAAWAGTAVLERRSLLAALGCGAALGLGMLVKGPHALYVPVGAIAGGAVAARRARRRPDGRWLVALLTMAAVFGAWLVPALAEGGDAYRERLIGQLASRVSGRAEPHAHGFAYLVGLFFAFSLPWTPAIVAGAASAFRTPSPPADDRFGLGAALGGVLLPLVLLSIPASKREVYLVPLLPCASMLAAYALHRAAPDRVTRWLPHAAALAAAAVGIAFVGAPFVAPRLFSGGPSEPVAGHTLAEGATPYVLVAAGLASLGAGVVAWRRRRDGVGATRAAALGVGAAWVIVAIGVLPTLDDTKTWGAAVPIVRAEARGAGLVAVGFNDASLAWAVRPDDVPRLAPDPADTPKVLDDLFAPGAPRVLAAVKTRDWQAARQAVPSLASRVRVLWERRVGPWVFTLLGPSDQRVR